MQYKILFIVKNSKTKTTGYYQMNSYVVNSTKLKKEFKTKIINLYSNSENKLTRFLKLISYSWLIFINLLKFKPELIYFTISPVNAFYRDLIYVFILKLFKIKIVCHLHGKGIAAKAKENKLNLKLYTWAYRNVEVILVSEKLKHDIEFLPVKSIYILPNAVPSVSLQDLPEKTKRNVNSPLHILFLSNLIKSKGIFDFIEAVKILKEEKLNIYFDIVGKEIDVKKDELISKMDNINDNVTFHGPLYGNDKNRMLQNSDILVFPTLSDIWGIVILEAMQFGLTVIATDEGAITDMIEHGVNGFIIKKNDSVAISSKIKYLERNRDKLNEIGKNNIKKYRDNFTIEKFESSLISILDKIILDKT